MKHDHSLSRALILTAVLSLGSILGVEASVLRDVVRIGDPSPDGNGHFDRYLRVLSVAGDRVLFSAYMADTIDEPLDTYGIFLYANGSLTQIIREGDPAPDGNGIFDELESYTTQFVSEFGVVLLHVTFRDTTGGGTDEEAVLLYRDGDLSILAREGSPAPDGSAGTILEHGIRDAVMNTAGKVALNLNCSVFSGIFSHSALSGSSNLSVKIGSASPDGNGAFSRFESVSIGNSSGDFTFAADLSGTASGTKDDEGVFIYRTIGGVTEVARKGDAMPDGNGTISSMVPSAPRSGRFNFRVYVDDSIGGSSDDRAILRYDGNSITSVAREGDPAPDGNGVYGTLTNTPVLAESSGDAAFGHTFTGTALGPADNSAALRIDYHTGKASIRLRENDLLPNGQVAGQISGTITASPDTFLFTDNDGAYYDLESSIEVVAHSSAAIPEIFFNLYADIRYGLGSYKNGAFNSLEAIVLFSVISPPSWEGDDEDSWDDTTSWNLPFAPRYGGETKVQPFLGTTIHGPSEPVYPVALDLGALGPLPATFDLKTSGSIHLVDGMNLDNAILTGSGLVDGPVDASADSIIAPAGQMALGANSTDGFSSMGSIYLGGHRLTLLDDDGAMLGGEIDLEGGVLDVPGGTSNTGIIRGGGRIEGPGITNEGDINILLDHLIMDAAVFNAEDTGLINARDALLEFNSGLTNAGSLAISFGTTDIFGDITVTKSGRVVVSGFSNVTFWDDLVHKGPDFKVSTGSSVVFFGDVSGEGSFSGTGETYFEGDYQPGASPASIGFGGDLYLGASSSLEMELAGLIPGTEHDQVVTPGTMYFDGGVLEIILLDEFVPTPGMEFLLFDAGDIEGGFSSILLPSLPAGAFWDTRSIASDGILRVGVSPENYVAWLAAWGITGAGDHEGDGIEDSMEYVLGTDPTTRTSIDRLPELVTDEVEGSDHVGLAFTIPYPAASDVVYEVQSSTTLDGVWSAIATKIGSGPWTGSELVDVVINPDGTQSIEVLGGAIPTPSAEEFFRLRGMVSP